MSEMTNIAWPDVKAVDATCDKCGLALTTEMMAALCPNAMTCEFWPHSNGSPNQDGAELFMARAWIRNACEQIGLQIADRKRLSDELRAMAMEELPRLMSDISEDHWAAGWMSDTEHRLWKAIADEHDDGQWGMGTITEEQKARLARLSEIVGGWFDIDGFVPMAEWQRRVREFPR